jgi:hypothetical protein
LARIVRRLESLAEQDAARWRDLLTYIYALVYNQRSPGEQARLQRTIVDAVQTDEHRRESGQMAKTIAEALIEQGEETGREQGALRARQQTLLRQLRRRFGELPPPAVEVVEATHDVERLDEWLERILTAAAFDDMGIETSP